MDISKARSELGWGPAHTFDKGLEATVEWYLTNRDWWERVRSGAYRDYYERQYGNRVR